MADAKISSLTQATAVAGDEEFYGLLSDGTTDRSFGPRLIAASQYPDAGSSLALLPVVHEPGASSLTLVAGTRYGNVFVARPGAVFDRLLMEITTVLGAATGNMRVGAYGHDFATRLPDSNAPIYDSGDIALTNTAPWDASTTPKSVTLGAGGITVPASGVFWVVIAFDNTITLKRGGPNRSRCTQFVAQGNAANLLNTGLNHNCGASAAGTYGAMPTPAGLSATFSIPLIALMKS